MSRFAPGFFLSLALLLSVGPVASAQEAAAPPAGAPAGMPQGMPDPRQMSGIPRPDGAVPIGTVTVRMVQGALTNPAPAETVVHLVGVAADGTVTRTSQALGPASRAEFKDVKIDGSIVYYAVAQLGEDRLMSQEIMPDATAGLRVMLAGRKLDAQGKPTGPVIDDQSGQGAPIDQVPVGDAWIDLRGAGPFSDVEIVEVGTSGKAARVVAKVKVASIRDTEFLAQVTGLASGVDKVYVARSLTGSKRFQSKPFQISPNAGTRVAILGVAQLLFGLHAGGQVDDDKLWFEAQLALANLSGAPYDPGPDGVFIPLPAGFINANVSDESMGSSKVKIDPKKGVFWRGPIPPGQHEVVVQWAHQVEDGAVAFDLSSELGIAQGQVIVDHAPGSTVSGEGLTPKLQRSNTGREFYVMGGLSVEPGGRLKFQIEGLPQPSSSARAVRLGAGVVVFGLLGLAFFSAVAGKGGRAAPDPLVRRKELVGRRDAALDELVRLERKRAKASAEERAASDETREAQLAALAALHREIDLIDALAAKTKAKAGS